MRGPGADNTTKLILAWRHGDADAIDGLLPIVYDQLAGLASRALRGERGNHTLQSRALVHEAYLRLIQGDLAFNDRAHFLALAARTMRRVLVDHARARRRNKRGGEQVQVPLEHIEPEVQAPPIVDVIALNDAIERLHEFDPRKSQIVELHFFGGLSYDETAAAVGVSPATVDRELRLAKAWMRVHLAGGTQS
jgi:RNA polymerase sigma-70 factor (ECF subfamily)